LKRPGERIIEGALAFSGLITILTTVGIIAVLFNESFRFFQQVSLWDFLTDTQWTPLFTQKHYGILPLLVGTLLTTFIAIATALPIGLTIAIYLSEYANKNFRKNVKPALELLGRVADLARLEESSAAMEIGAAVTYTDAAPALARHYPDMGEVFRRLGSVPIRNAGTIGGNVANGSPIGDSPPMLIAAGATLQLRRGGGRRTLPIEDYFIAYGQQDRQPGEFVEKIIVPTPPPGTRFRAYKISKRFDQDISAVLGAGLQAELGPRLGFAAGYDVQVQSGLTVHALTAKLRVAF